MERKKENSSAASRDIPATCPAAIVHIEREVPERPPRAPDRADPDRGRQVRLRPSAEFWPNEKRIDQPHHDAADEERERHHVEVFEILADQLAEQKSGDRGDDERDQDETEGVGETRSDHRVRRAERCAEISGCGARRTRLGRELRPAG